MKHRHTTRQPLPQSSLPTKTSIHTTVKPALSGVSPGLSVWVLLPLKLFLGITFVYAGIQKLTDPQFFHPSARGFIGNQIHAFAPGSPLHDVLINVVVPHAAIFGALVAYGEIAIGVGTLVGFLLRPAAFFGLLLSLLFFLSASWHVYPYFYGADIVFVFGWLTLLLAGPAGSFLPALDVLLLSRLMRNMPDRMQPRLNNLLFLLLGGRTPTRVVSSNKDLVHGNVSRRGRAQVRLSQAARRNFLWGLVTGSSGLLLAWWVGQNLHLFPSLADDASSTNASQPTTFPNSGQSTNSAPASPVPTATKRPRRPYSSDDEGPESEADSEGRRPSTVPPSSGTPGISTPIAQMNAVPPNSAKAFIIPSNGDPGVLVHLKNGQFVAFDATCTHAGCHVQYDSSSQHLLCPCHGAEFDPVNNAAVVQGPTTIPLVRVPISIDNTTGKISITG